MKIAYIAHPISGDVSENIKKLVEIAREINLTEPDVVPFAPYLIDLYALSDDVPEHRARCIRNDMEIFKRECIDELRLYGPNIGGGMKAEIVLAEELGIKVVPMTEETEQQYYRKLKL